MKALNGIPVRDTPVGLVACLPPMIHVEVLGLDWPVAVGDVLGVVTKCDHVIAGHPGWWCGCGDGITDEKHRTTGMCATCAMFSDAEPCAGYAPLRFVKVLDVWPIVDDPNAVDKEACIESDQPDVWHWAAGAVGVDRTRLNLPDAEPGGVALHVEWTDCPTCDGDEWVARDFGLASLGQPTIVRCPTCQTPFVPPSDAPIVEVAT